MGQINLYKIDIDKKSDLIRTLDANYGTPLSRDVEKTGISYTLSFYYLLRGGTTSVSWEWVFQVFGVSVPTVKGGPKGVIVVENTTIEVTYAVTFGASYFLIDKYCDRDFGFEYACRIPYEKISLTALTNPVSLKNKTINSFVNYKDLEFDSGESFAKIKGKIGTSGVCDFMKATIEVGSAIKFHLKTDSLDHIVDLVVHAEQILGQEKITKIPVFKKVKDPILLSELQQHLIEHLQQNSATVLISEFGVIGTTEVFNRCDEYKLKLEGAEASFSELTLENISAFCTEHDITDPDNVLSIKVKFMVDGAARNTTSLLEIFDFMDEAKRCLLIQGVWYEFNADYLESLRDSLTEIKVSYVEDYDLKDSQLNEFRAQKTEAERNNPEYAGKTSAELQKAINRKYYKERAYNMMRAADGFQLFDRGMTRIGSADIELMDLFKDNTMFAVKFGKSSGDLSYVIPQSLMSVKAYKEGLISNAPPIDNVAIWLVLERREKISVEENRFDWDELNMLVLKNQIDQWKKAVRLAGYQPQIYINYRIEE